MQFFLFSFFFEDRKKLTQLTSYIKLKIPDFYISHEVNDSRNLLAIDSEKSKICLVQKVSADEFSHRIFDYHDILSSELFENGTTITKTQRSSQIAGAAVGGVLLGGVGAVIGGLSAKKLQDEKVDRIELRIVVNDSKDPTFDICFLSQQVDHRGGFHILANQEAREWHARLEVLIKRADQEMKDKLQRSEPDIPSAVASIGDELKKLVDLRAEGILSDEEFVALKKKLLK